jgi:hypothetical protein
MPNGLFMSSSFTTSKCLTWFCIIISAATPTSEIASVVTRASDIISRTELSLLLASWTHTFLTKSLSVIMPTVLLLASITTSELTFLSRIFIAASWADKDASIVSSFSVIKSPIFVKLSTLNRINCYPYKD